MSKKRERNLNYEQSGLSLPCRTQVSSSTGIQLVLFLSPFIKQIKCFLANYCLVAVKSASTLYRRKKINWFLSSFILCRTTAFLFVSKHIFSAFSLLHSERLVQIKIMQNRKKTREFNVRNQNEKVNEWKRVSEKKLKIKPKARINGRLTGQPANTCLWQAQQRTEWQRYNERSNKLRDKMSIRE